MPPSYHVHFGAGKLGLGFVLPILDNMELPIALFQRPGSEEWQKLDCDQDVLFQVNSEDLLDCKYISDNCELATLQRYIEEQRHLFVSTCRIDLLRAVLSVTHSFSTAVAAGGLDDVLEGLALLPSYYPDIRVYTFENDFKAVEAFRKKVNEKLPGLTVISVMCDRICTHREIIPVNRVNTITEDFPGTAVIFSSNVSYCHPFTTPRSVRRKCTPSNVVLARTPGEETFYYNRKFSLLNGIHYTMAVFTFSLLMEQGVAPADWFDKRLSLWKTKKNVEMLQMLVEARIIFLLSQTDKTTLSSVYDTEDKKKIYAELKAFSNTVLGRIDSASDDTAGRILNLKNATAVKTKYEQHFMPLATFLRSGKDRFAMFTDIAPHTHSEYLEVVNIWDRRIRNVTSAHGIELPKPVPTEPTQVVPCEREQKQKEDAKKGLSFAIWQESN